jgi:acetoin utilization deacetylase AcuC-like enzyme
MTLLYYDPVFLEHDTGDHPECADRIIPLVRHLNFVALDTRCTRPSWKPISLQRLARVHSLSYVQAVQAFAAGGGGRIEVDTVVSKQSYHVALMAAGAICDAVERVVRREDTQALCLVRPPGHHALEHGAMGFCLFNNVAIGSRLATTELGVDRVLIVDWDVHHGNGSQATFWEDSRVGYLSIHRWPFYPFTGAADETGGGKGLGTIHNLPVTFGTPRAAYLSCFTTELERFAADVKPQLVMVSAGFDSHRADPIGSLGLESEDFGPLTRAVLDVADSYADGKIVSVLEGGYNPDALTECVEIHLREMLTRQAEHDRSNKPSTE